LCITCGNKYICQVFQELFWPAQAGLGYAGFKGRVLTSAGDMCGSRINRERQWCRAKSCISLIYQYNLWLEKVYKSGAFCLQRIRSLTQPPHPISVSANWHYSKMKSTTTSIFLALLLPAVMATTHTLCYNYFLNKDGCVFSAAASDQRCPAPVKEHSTPVQAVSSSLCSMAKKGSDIFLLVYLLVWHDFRFQLAQAQRESSFRAPIWHHQTCVSLVLLQFPSSSLLIPLFGLIRALRSLVAKV
jgi:hypothetical protein